MVLAAALGQIGLPGGGYAYALGRDRLLRPPRQRRAGADAAAGPQRRQRFHSGGAHRRHAAQSRQHLSLQRRDAHLSGHPPGLLGRRQSLPSPPGHQPPAQGLCAGRHAGRARTRLDRDRAARRHRAARDDDARARGHRLFHQRSADGRHAPHRRAVWAGARRLRDLCRSRRTPRRARTLHRRPHARAMAGASLRADARLARQARASRRRASRNSGSAAA